MVRPKKSPALVRNNLLPVRLSDVELEMFRSRAEDLGIPIAELMRRNGLMRPIPKRLSRITIQTYRELSRVGTNINQLSKAINTALKSGQQIQIDQEELVSLAAAIDRCQRELVSLAAAIDRCQRELVFGIPDEEEDELFLEDEEVDDLEDEANDSEN
jgi:Bacterial mobilisation protein (MobC)